MGKGLLPNADVVVPPPKADGVLANPEPNKEGLLVFEAGVVEPIPPKPDVPVPVVPCVAEGAPNAPVVVPVEGAPNADGVDDPNALPVPCPNNPPPLGVGPDGVLAVPNAPPVDVDGAAVGCPGVDGFVPNCPD